MSILLQILLPMAKEDLHMDAQLLWELFLDTGSPEIYLLYKKAMREVVPQTA